MEKTGEPSAAARAVKEKISVLKNQNESMRLVAENLPCGIMKRKADGSGEVVYVSSGFILMQKCEPDVLKCYGERVRSFYDWVSEYDRERVREAFEAASFREADEWASLEYRLKKCGGDEIWIHDKSKFLIENGEEYIYSILLDITDRKNAERELEINRKQMELALKNAPYVLFVYDLDKHIVTMQRGNPKYAKVARVNHGAPMCFVENRVVAQADAQVFVDMHNSILAGNESSTGEVRLRTLGGDYEWTRITLTAFHDGDERAREAVGVIEDIDVRKKTEIAYAKEEQYRKAMIASSIEYCDMNLTKNKLERIEGKWDVLIERERRRLADPDDYAETVASCAAKLVLPQYRELYVSMLDRKNLLKMFADGKTAVSFEHKRWRPDDTEIWVSTTVHLMRDETTGDVRGFAYMKDVDSEKNEVAGLMYLSQRVALTGLYNRAVGEKLINDFLGESESKNGRHAFFFLDLDHFKSINDTHGHMHGDDILRDMAECITKQLRVSDIPVRLGGDEFAVLVKNIRDLEHIRAKAREFCETIAAAGGKYEPKIDSSVSIGIAVTPDDGDDFNTLYQKSDAALYKVKHEGRSGYEFFNDKFNA